MSLLSRVFVPVVVGALAFSACTIDSGPQSAAPATTDASPAVAEAPTPLAFQDTTPAPGGQGIVPNGFVKIANGDGGFSADIGQADRFGRDHDSAGDIDGDGIIDLVVGARSDDDGPTGADTLTDAGAVYILFMNQDGTVRSHQKISALLGGFDEPLIQGSHFGYGVAGIGDYDRDGIPDIAASAPGSQLTRGNFDPTVYIMHLNRNGTVKSVVAESGIPSQGLSAIGDLDGDGREDLVAADPTGGTAGRIRILFFDANSQLRANDTVVIGADEGGFAGDVGAGEGFGGRESAMLGDLDGDGSLELAVGAYTSGNGQGAVWILSLDSETFEVLDEEKLTPGIGGLGDPLPVTENPNGTSGAHFGHALVAAGDLDGDGVPDLITSANQHEDGVAYIVYLSPNKRVKDFSRIDSDEGGFGLTLDAEERFGRSMSIVNHPDGSITVNMGGGAGVQQGGAIYALDFDTNGDGATPALLCGDLPVTVNLADGDTPTQGDDVIRGTAGNDIIDGLDGNDTICALQGSDTIDGGDGFDMIFAGAGNDTIVGGTGNDTLIGGLGFDTIFGGVGNDRLQGGDGADTLNGEGGLDIVYGGNGNDIISGGTHADTLYGNLGRDDISGDGGNDTIRGGAWLDSMDGGAGSDGCTLTDPSGLVEVRTSCETGVFGR